MKIQEREKEILKQEKLLFYAIKDFGLQNKTMKMSQIRNTINKLQANIELYYNKLYRTIKSWDDFYLLINICNFVDIFYDLQAPIKYMYIDIHQGATAPNKGFYNVLENRLLKSIETRQMVVDLIGATL